MGKRHLHKRLQRKYKKIFIQKEQHFLVGCNAPLRFELAISDILEAEQHIIDTVHRIMVQLCGLFLFAESRRLTRSPPIPRTKARISSVHEML